MNTANTNILTRGERNNNPGNINKNSIVWKGIAAVSTDIRFCTFKTAAYGIRAIGKLVSTYYHTYKLDTIAKIINRWAPPAENNTNAYIKAVCNTCNLKADDLITKLTPTIQMQLVKAIITHENDRCIYTDTEIASALLII